MVNHLWWLFGPKLLSQVPRESWWAFWNDFISVFKASIFHWVVSLDNQRKEFLTNIVVSLGGALPHFKKLATQFRTSCVVLEDINSQEWAIFDAIPLTVSTKQCLKTFPNSANIQVFLLGSSLSVWRFIIYICWEACQADAGVADLWRHVDSCSKERLECCPLSEDWAVPVTELHVSV